MCVRELGAPGGTQFDDRTAGVSGIDATTYQTTLGRVGHQSTRPRLVDPCGVGELGDGVRTSLERVEQSEARSPAETVVRAMNAVLGATVPAVLPTRATYAAAAWTAALQPSRLLIAPHGH